jgi:hypothetical protein
MYCLCKYNFSQALWLHFDFEPLEHCKHALKEWEMTYFMWVDICYICLSIEVCTSCYTDTFTVSHSYAEALNAVEEVLEITWEELNTGHWSKVPLFPRQLYTAAAIIKVCASFMGPEKLH